MHALSIITVNLNNKAGLAETFASVFSQTFTAFEFIVIDGGSTDGSAELMEQHADKITYRVSEKDKGIYDAMNKGAAAASGRYLVFLNSGDCFAGADALARCHQYIIDFPAADIFYADMYSVNGAGAAPEAYIHPATLTLKYLKKRIPTQQASLIRLGLFEETGVFPLQYWLASDYWFYLKCFLAGKTFVYMNFIMTRYDATGLSATNAQVCFAEMDDIWKQLVPKHLRRSIDRMEAFRRSAIGKIFLQVRSKLQAVFS